MGLDLHRPRISSKHYDRVLRRLPVESVDIELFTGESPESFDNCASAGR